MRARFAGVVLLAACAGKVGAGSDGGIDAPARDSGGAEPSIDATRDVAIDVAIDLTIDLAVDVALDTPVPDVSPDTPVDVAADVAPDAAPDVTSAEPSPDVFAPPDFAGDFPSSCNGLDACACEIAACQRVTQGCSCPSDFCIECGTGCGVMCLCGGGPYIGCAPSGCPAELTCAPGCQFVDVDGCLACTPGC